MPAASLAMYARRDMSPTPSSQRAAEEARLSAKVADLFQGHAEPMLRAALRVTGSLQDAEDVLQGVFVRLVQRPEALAELRGPDAGPYLHRAAVNAALDLLRARARRPVADIAAAEQPGAGGDTADATLLRDALAEDLRTGLAGLHPRAAEMVTLRYLDELSNQEVALRTGASESTVAVTLHRARQTLRERLSPKGGRE